MRSLTANEQDALLVLGTDPLQRFTATGLARARDLSVMGAAKILARLADQDIVAFERIGNAKRFRLRFERPYVRALLSLLLRKRAEEARPLVRRWIRDLRRLEPHARIGILFGSALTRDDPGDIDVLVELDPDRRDQVRAVLEGIRAASPIPIHLVEQAPGDLARNVVDDPVVREIARGVVLFGYDAFVEVMADVAREAHGRVVSREG